MSSSAAGAWLRRSFRSPPRLCAPTKKSAPQLSQTFLLQGFELGLDTPNVLTKLGGERVVAFPLGVVAHRAQAFEAVFETVYRICGGDDPVEACIDARLYFPERLFVWSRIRLFEQFFK